MSIVFKLNSIEDLGKLYEALKQAMTLQEKVKLENQIRNLARTKENLQGELKILKDEIRELSPSELKVSEKGNMKDEEDETSAFDADVETIVELTEEGPDIERVNANDERFIVEETREAVQERE